MYLHFGFRRFFFKEARPHPIAIPKKEKSARNQICMGLMGRGRHSDKVGVGRNPSHWHIGRA